MPSTFGIVDLFAGPGGLGEGFASLVEDGHAPFRIGISVEKEASAHRTLARKDDDGDPSRKTWSRGMG